MLLFIFGIGMGKDVVKLACLILSFRIPRLYTGWLFTASVRFSLDILAGSSSKTFKILMIVLVQKDMCTR